MTSDLSTPAKFCPKCGRGANAATVACPTDGTPVLPQPGNDPQFRGKYEFLGVVGTGGMAVIFKARQALLNRMVAIKMLQPHVLSPEAYQQFQIESKAASILSHPYIVSIHDTGVSEFGQPYMIMDYVEGMNLGQVIARDGPMNKARFMRIFTQVAEALEHAHSRGVVHRDIKASNIMLLINEFGLEEVRLMDFGIARIANDTAAGAEPRRAASREVVGSPPYMSPEQALGKVMDLRSDLYSLGCVMYEALTGNPPFIGNTHLDTMYLHINEKPAPLQPISAACVEDPQIETIVLHLLEKKPTDRYQSAQQLIADLNGIGNAGDDIERTRALHRLTAERPVVKPSKPRQKKTARRWPSMTQIAVAIGVQTLIAIGAYVVYQIRLQRKFDPIAKPINTEGVKFEHLDETAQKKLAKEVDGGLETDVAEIASKNFIADMVRMKRPIFMKGLLAHGIAPEDMDPLLNASYLKELDLTDLQMTTEHLKRLRNLTLDSLILDDNPIDDIDPIKNMKTLTQLSLTKTNVATDGAKVIHNFTNLKSLGLGKTPITDKDLPYLYNLQKLNRIQIYDCPNLTAPAIIKLKEHLPPGCEINCSYEEVFVPKPILQALSNAEQALNAKRFANAYAAAIDAESRIEHVPNFEKDNSIVNRLINVLNVKGKSLMGEKKFAEAEKTFDKAIRLIQKHTDKIPGRAEILCDLATCKEVLNPKADTLALRKEAGEIFDSPDVGDGNIATWREYHVNNLRRMSELYLQGDPINGVVRAEELLQKALKILSEGGRQNSLEAGFVYQRLGDVQLNRTQYTEAIRLYERAMIIDRNNLDDSHRGEINNSIASARYGLGDFAGAEQLMKIELSKPADKSTRKNQYSLMIKALRGQHRDREAAHYEQLLTK